MTPSTEPTATAPDHSFPLGTRIQYNDLTGTVVDPDHLLLGQRDKGYRPSFDGVWIHLDPRHHTRGVNGHGMWVQLGDPDLRRFAGGSDAT